MKAGNSQSKFEKETIMKNSAAGQNGTRSRVSRSILILLVFATFAFSNSAKAADSKNLPSDGRSIIRPVNLPHSDGTVFKIPEPDPDAGGLSGDPLLFAQQPATWCYTNFGRFPMLVALPPGYGCSVNLPTWPYLVTGITGY
jgi:hypothetical protein